MFRTLALTTLTLLALDATLAATTGGSLTSVAHAADDTASIKKATVKTQATSSGNYTHSFWIKPLGKPNSRVATVAGSISDPITGAILEEVVLADPIRARLVFTGTPPSGGASLESLRVVPEFAEGSAAGFGFDDAELEELAAGLTLDALGEAVVGPLKLRARLTGEGGLRVVVMHEDKDWDPDTITGVTVADAGGASSALTLDGIREVFKQRLTGDYVFEDDIMLRATALDADGVVLDTIQQTVTLTDEVAAEPGLSSATLKQTRGGDAKLVSWTRSDGTASALEVELVDNATGEAVLMTVDDTPLQTSRGYAHDLLEFDPGESPVGYTYLCLVDLIDNNGDPTGEQMEAELVVPAYDALAGAPGTAWQPLVDAAGQALGVVGFLALEDGVAVAMSYSGEDARDVASANLIFEEPYEGPAPLESEVNLSLRGELSKWVQKGATAVPEAYTLVTTLVTPEGEVLGSTTATGAGTGAVYRTAGVGDKEAMLNIGFKSEGGVPLSAE